MVARVCFPATFLNVSCTQVAKLAEVEKELAETQRKLNVGRRGESPQEPLWRGARSLRVILPFISSDSSSSSTEDPLDAFMTAVRSEAVMDSVERKKLHLHVADLRKDALRLRKLVELTRPTQIPSLLSK